MVASGAWHHCALLSSNAIKCWGQNRYGQLGAPITANCNTPEYPIPCARTPVDGPNIASPIAALTAGGYHTCALLAAGRVECWGSNEYGQLGNGTNLDSMVPVEVLTDSGAPLNGIVQIAGGEGFTCALRVTGAVICWGENDKGQLGDGTTADRWLPAEVIGLGELAIAVASGSYSYTTCVVTASGAAKCWGDGAGGQLGNGTRGTDNHSPVPVDVTGLGSGVVALATGYIHTCALMEVGTAKCWGNHTYRQLGHTSVYGGFSTTPVDVCRTYNPSLQQCDDLESGLSAIVAGGFHTCGIPAAQGIRCWGTDILDQLGCLSCVTPTAPVVDVRFDADGDGMVDALELATTCLEWKAADATSDPDQDGAATDRELLYYQATDPCDPDSDNDGCMDGHEMDNRSPPRQPRNSWDFFDTPDANNQRDKVVSILDIMGFIARFGASGDPNIDPLSAPAPAPAYHTAFDRGYTDQVWTFLPPDGSIAIGEIVGAVAEFGQSCASLAPPAP
jgi:hypothetical protein